MKKSQLKKLIKVVLNESQNDDVFKSGTYKLSVSPSGDGRDWTTMSYVHLSKPMTKLEALQVLFKKMNWKFHNNDAFAYEFEKIDPKRIKIINI